HGILARSSARDRREIRREIIRNDASEEDRRTTDQTSTNPTIRAQEVPRIRRNQENNREIRQVGGHLRTGRPRRRRVLRSAGQYQAVGAVTNRQGSRRGDARSRRLLR